MRRVVFVLIALVLVGCGAATPSPTPARVATPAVVFAAVPLGSMTGQQFAALSASDRFKAVDTALLNYRCPDAVSYTQIAAESATIASTAPNGPALIVPLIIATALRDGCVAV